MSTGLLALLDDIAAIAKVTAASLDDVAAQAGAAGSKAAGVVIDDAAVTPKYVVGLSPKRELPIIWNIAKGSLKNKLLFLIPSALILGSIAPWAITPILALGGLYLCYEGYEKLHEAVHKLLHKKEHQDHIVHPENLKIISPEELEKKRTNSAIRTDFILSAEIVALTYSVVAASSFIVQAMVLGIIAIGVTLGVYGAVAIIVKADDVGAHLAKYGEYSLTRKFGHGVIKAMPHFLKVLGSVGTAAMLWVGGGIIIHNIPFLHHQMEHLTHMTHLDGLLKWFFEASLSALFGLIIGGIADKILKTVKRFTPKKSVDN
jgi:predicted DNA repair protein MutK